MRLSYALLRVAVFIGVFGVFAANLLVQSAVANDKKSEDAQAAKALLDKASKVTNIEAAGAQPFLLVAKTSWTQYGKTTDGQFALAWQAADRYRRETTLPGFLEAVVVHGNVLYRTRNIDFIPLAAFRPAALIDVPHTFTAWPTKEMKIDNGSPKQLSGATNFRCVSAVTEFMRASVRHIACFDNSTGVPLLEQQQFSSGGEETLTYTDYVPLNASEFPRHVKYEDSTGAQGEVEVVKLEAVTSFPDSTFQRPAQSTEQPWCATPQASNAPATDWVTDNWLEWRSGLTVQLEEPVAFVTVDAKGDVRNVALFGELPDANGRAAVSTIRKDKFAVKTCGGTAVPYETIVRLIRTRSRGPVFIVEKPLTN